MRGICIVAVLLGVALDGTAAAQGGQALPRAADKAEADRLFEEGRALLAAGDRAEACKRFDLSIRKDPRAVGTMLNLGLCREEVGQIASALRFYAEARDRAHDQKLTEHESAASRKIAMLSPRVPRLTIILPADLRGDVRVLVDDLVFGRDSLTDITVDPGQHTIVVTVPGKLPYETTIDVKESEKPTITVPALQGAKTVIVRERTSRRATWGKILLASGVALAGGGVGVGLFGRSQYWAEFPTGARDGIAVMDATHDCWTTINGGAVERECNTRGVESTRSARRLSQIGIATSVVGGVVAVGGLVMWLTAPKPSAEPTVSFDLRDGGATFAYGRSF